jgi:hypothetical protein
MDLSNQLDGIVAGLVKDIEGKLNSRVEVLVGDYLTRNLHNYDYESKINWLASVKLDNMIAGLEINRTNIEKRLDSVSDALFQNIEVECRNIATEHVKKRLYNDVDINQVVRELVAEEVVRRIKRMDFPVHSIPANAINPENFTLTGNNIVGGIIKQFSSAGIEDKSTSVQMTLIDEGVIIENKVVALGLDIHGTTILRGDVVIEGEVPERSKFYTSIIDNAVKGVKESMDSAFFGDYSSVIFEKIKQEGLDLNKITLNGTEVIVGNKLNYGITDSNITRVGLIKDLQTQGETYLSEQLYVGKNKVGIGTIDPGNSLTVWDQEVELGFGKRLKDTGWMGTPRNQDLIISANNKDNIVLTADGQVKVNKITVNKVTITSYPSTPSDDQPKGTVAFNENPAIGQPIGWVSLGNGVWSKFGIVG